MLTIPLDEHLMDDIEPVLSEKAYSDDYEEYDQISDEGYTSNSRQTTIIDEPPETSQVRFPDVTQSLPSLDWPRSLRLRPEHRG